MGLVKISEQMHANLRSTSAALSRSINAQAEHWMRVGMLAELNPDFSYRDICHLLIQAEASEDTSLSVDAAADTQAPDRSSIRAVSR